MECFSLFVFFSRANKDSNAWALCPGERGILYINLNTAAPGNADHSPLVSSGLTTLHSCFWFDYWTWFEKLNKVTTPHLSVSDSLICVFLFVFVSVCLFLLCVCVSLCVKWIRNKKVVRKEERRNPEEADCSVFLPSLLNGRLADCSPLSLGDLVLYMLHASIYNFLPSPMAL